MMAWRRVEGGYELLAPVMWIAGIHVLEIACIFNGHLIPLLWIVGAIALTLERACYTHTAD